MKKFYAFSKGFFVACLLLSGYGSHAQPVLLDPAFGNNGKVITNPPLSNKYGMQANEMAVQADGKVVVAISSYFDLSVSDTSKFIVARYNTDGSLDATFGTGGMVVTGINNKEDVATTLALQPDGKIIAAGYTTFTGFYTDWAMVRYNTNGTPDSSFGANGVVINSRSASTEHIFSIAVKPDGKIVAAGDVSGATQTQVMQFNANGTVDSTFGINGVAGFAPVMTVAKLVLQPDGKIVAAGKILNTDDSIAVFRFSPNGQPDSSFGTAGKAYVLFTYGRINSLSLQPDGKMILVGRASDLANNNTQVALARLHVNGSVDSTFGTNGKAYSLGGTGDQGYRVIVRPDGKFLVAASKDKGFSYMPPVYGNFALLKYNSNGSPDSTFGKRGVILTDFAGLNDEAYCAALQPDGKIIMSGFTVQSGKNKIALLRYQSAGLTYYNTIYAAAFYDNNLNGVKETSEPYFSQATITTLKPGTDTISIATNGKFSAEIDTGSYVTSVHPYHPYFSIVPVPHITSNNTYFNYDSVAFAVQPVAGKRDIEIQLFPLGIARPGFPLQYKIFLKNNGTDTIPADSIQLIKSAKLNFNASYPAPNSIKGDTLRWGFSTLKPLDTLGIVLYLAVKAPPTVNFGDTLVSIARIDSIANDLAPGNNTSTLVQVARGANDPNNKIENHGGKITLAEAINGGYLTYTINFQNTGNDTAFNIYIRDTLSNLLDWNTFEMLTASANYQMTLNDGKCEWTFNMIKLVDSIHNEPKSHGYLVFRVKPKSNVRVADVVTNQAAIYFDYNLPVPTNTETTIVVANVFPLKLLTFTAKKIGKTNLLEWHSSNETNGDRFVVERGSGEREFYKMENGELRMENGRHEYRFIDNAPVIKHSNYYRLKMFDKDGSFTYSPVKVISNGSGGFIAGVYPNPSKDKLHVQLESEKVTILQMEIVAHNGKVMLSQQWSINEGASVKTIKTDFLQKGMYFLKLTLRDKEQSVVGFEKL